MTTTVVATGPGGPEVLSIVDEPIASPGVDQVLVTVKAIGTNPVDYKVYGGVSSLGPGQFPMYLGFELAGVVSAVPEGTVGPAGPIQVGDEVVAYPAPGAYAAEVLVPASSVVPKPSNISFEEASGLMLAGATAVHALRVTGVEAGDTVVIHGASGGVGLLAVQLAVAAGARVIGTASEARHEYLRTLGAEPTTYGPDLINRIRALAPEGVDAAIDGVGTEEALETSVELVADRDRIATIAGSARGFELGVRVLGRAPGADDGYEIRSAARLDLVAEAEAGRLSVLVAETFPLTEAATAHRLLAEGHTHGKIVLIP
jgi:NADPH:quinone reductase-like Zn-dependent oxidoreductase